jgi:quercetin dioxygenase-like cupin family protein
LFHTTSANLNGELHTPQNRGGVKMKTFFYTVISVIVVTLTWGFPGNTVIAADQLQADPNVKVLLENDEVRIFEATRSPGTKVPMHEHPTMAVYFFSSYKANQTLPNGKIMEKDYKAGKAAWLPDGLKHAIEIVGTADQHVLVIELKK